MSKQDPRSHYQVMTKTPIPSLIVKLGIPTTVTMLITNIYNLADTAFVGRLGTSESGAVGVVFGLMAIIQAFAYMFGQGAGSIAARALGRQDYEAANRFSSTAVFSSAGVGLLIAVFGLCFKSRLAILLGSTPTIAPYAKAYMTYILLAAPFMSASLTMNNVLRYEGHASFAMIGLTTGGILNIILDPILMFKLNMGVAGAGCATAISQFISFSILSFMFISGKSSIKLSIKSYTRSFRDLWEILTTGAPSLVRQGLTSVTTMMLNTYAGAYGDAAVSAMSIVNRVTMFVFAVSLGMGQGFQPVAAFNYGAGKFTRVKKSIYFTIILSEIMLCIIGGACLIFAGNLVQLFRDDPKVIEIGTYALRLRCYALVVMPISVVSEMAHQCTGQRARAFILSVFKNGLVLIPLLYLLSHTLGLVGIQWSQPLADMLTLVLNLPFMLIYIRHLPPDTPDGQAETL